MDRIKPTLRLPDIRREVVDWGAGPHPVFWFPIVAGVMILLPREDRNAGDG